MTDIQPNKSKYCEIGDIRICSFPQNGWLNEEVELVEYIPHPRDEQEKVWKIKNIQTGQIHTENFHRIWLDGLVRAAYNDYEICD